MASGSTPLRKRPYPNENDVPDAAADIKALALSLEPAPNVGQGTLAQRPTTGMATGDRFYVSGDSTPINNGIEWYYNGSQWVQITPDVQPVGSGAIYFADNDPVDTNWLICDGRQVSRTTYAVLFSKVGTAYGAGDGGTTFNLPDLRQRFPLGKKASGAGGSGTNLGEVGGQIDHTHPIPGLAVPGLGYSFAHSHPLNGTGVAGVNFAAERNGDLLAIEYAAQGWSWTDNWNADLALTSGDGLVTLQSGSNTENTAVQLFGSTNNVNVFGHTDNGITEGGTSGNQNPPYLTVNFIIKVS